MILRNIQTNKPTQARLIATQPFQHPLCFSLRNMVRFSCHPTTLPWILLLTLTHQDTIVYSFTPHFSKAFNHVLNFKSCLCPTERGLGQYAAEFLLPFCQYGPFGNRYNQDNFEQLWLSLNCSRGKTGPLDGSITGG